MGATALSTCIYRYRWRSSVELETYRLRPTFGCCSYHISAAVGDRSRPVVGDHRPHESLFTSTAHGLGTYS